MKEDDYKERVKRLQEVNAVIAKLDPAIKEHAFKLLESYITGKKSTQAETGQGGAGGEPDNMEEFFSGFDHEKPSDNAFCVAAPLPRHLVLFRPGSMSFSPPFRLSSYKRR